VKKIEDMEGDVLCAYLLSVKKNIDTGALKKALTEYLPVHMVPSFYVVLAEFPLLANGKVDLAALPRPESRAKASSELPASAFQAELVDLFSEVLGDVDRGTITVTDNFFDLGGNSLSAALLLSTVQTRYRARVSPTKFFQIATIEKLEAYLAARKQQALL
jgi:acyl carrier protein